MRTNNHFSYHILYRLKDLIRNNAKFISELETFRLKQPGYFWLLHSFLSSLSSLSTSIKHIDLYFNPTEVIEHFANIIQSQSQLSSITFRYLEMNTLKYFSNTLTSIMLLFQYY